MAKCRNCGGLVLRVGSKSGGLCGGCAATILPEIARARVRIKEGLVSVRYSNNDATVLVGLELVTEEARKLLPYERAGIPSTRPSPTTLLRLVFEQRAELLAREKVAELSPEVVPATVEVPVATEEERQERRRAERRKVSLYSLLEPGGLRALVGNVSESGLFLVGVSPRPLGSRVRMTLYTAQGAMRTSGVVRRVIAGRTGGTVGGEPGLGVQFASRLPELARRLVVRRDSATA